MIDAIFAGDNPYIPADPIIENPIPIEVRHEMALFFKACGIKPGWSTDISDTLSCGYGRLDDYGFWEYPII